ncbi:MAG: ATP-binding protein [Comamonadaceae bacterium]|nr:MAG: ATP-binding protein [Comamonadaceae bacterium]
MRRPESPPDRRCGNPQTSSRRCRRTRGRLMRLRSVWISQYKNLRDFSLTFEGGGFIDIFVGKNGSGKSNFLEALIEIFHHIGFSRAGTEGPGFDYELRYEINGQQIHLAWLDGDFSVNGASGRQTIGGTPSPEHLLVYYSGQNEKVSSLVRLYERDFRDSLQKATRPIAPRIIGIGPACKKLLIVTMLLLPEASLARQILCTKLGILNCRRTIELTIARPDFAPRDDHDPIDPDQIFWGLRGYARTFLQNLLDSIEGEFTPGQLYDRDAGVYRLTCNVDRLRKELGDDSGVVLFRSLDALRVLGMLNDIQLPFALEGLEVSGLDLFSDGQFQSVYLFAVAELFKHLNCVALLDEPDAFLHPEWQFEFLRQVNEISDQAARTNHILLTSHSASTIAGRSDGRVRMFEVGDAGVSARHSAKADLIRSLSAGLISFSETEAALSIDQLVANTTGAVLFTEGVTDAEIVKTAWDKLFPGQDRPFDIVQAFDCGHLRKQMVRDELYQNNPGRTFFALFDFDNAYGDWAAVGRVRASAVAAGQLEVADVERGLVCKRADQPGYAMLLPVPASLSVRHQVCNPNTGRTYGDGSRLTIELIFKDVPGLEGHFAEDTNHPAQWLQFVGGKVSFAQQVVPLLDRQYFEPFRPMFEFIQAKIAQP